MKTWSLQARFILAGCLIVAATIGSGLWSASTLRRLGTVVDSNLRESRETIDLSAELHGCLEREDDALLLFLSGDADAARLALQAERRRGDESFSKLKLKLQNGGIGEESLATELRRRIDQYREAGDELLSLTTPTGDLEWYHRKVNPNLRRVVAECDRLRESNFRMMQETAVRARDEAVRGTRFVSNISALTVFVGIAVAVWLARSILVPIKELKKSLEAIGGGNFNRRIRDFRTDELGELATGFNRMAQSLSEYRRSSLGELLIAKTILESTLNALPDGVLVISPEGKIVNMNPPARSILGQSVEGRAAGLKEIPFSNEHLATIEAALGGSPKGSHDFDFARTFNAVVSGEPRRYLVTASSIPDFSEGRSGAVVVFDDVTDFARLDELRSELIGVASHELKSPLTSIRMNLLMLAETIQQLSPRQQQLVSAAVQGCEELGITIEELLDITRIEAGQLRLNLTPINLCVILSNVKNSMQTRLDDAHIQFDVSADQADFTVLGDAVRLRSVFANILENALKYSPSGGTITVEMSSRQNPQSNSKPVVQIAVTDEGPGIPAELRERVFEKFFRVEHLFTHRKESARGTGIGLYLCREIVRAHEGAITCDTGKNGFGTQIAISLPAAR